MSRGKVIRFSYYFVLVAVAAGYGYAMTSMMRDHAVAASKSAAALISARR